MTALNTIVEGLYTEDNMSINQSDGVLPTEHLVHNGDEEGKDMVRNHNSLTVWINKSIDIIKVL